MSYGVKIRFWGEYALFSRPEMKTERVSYDVITPSAVRGMLEAIYWHPGLKWVVDRIHVMKPIKFTNIRRNEVKSKISCRSAKTAMNGKTDPIGISTSADIVQRASLLLTDVDYVIEAHFEMSDEANASDNSGKFKDIVMRRIKKGECYHNPYFGTREFPANFQLFEKEMIKTAYPNSTRDLGYMLYDLDYSDSECIEPMYFRAKLCDGTIEVCDCEVIK